jgi:hypothetical protein
MPNQHKPTRSDKVEQLALLPAKALCPPPDLERLTALPNWRRAMRYSISLADLEPKEVYVPMEKDKGTWSRIESGDMSLTVSELPKFQRIVGNDALLLWLNHDAGYDIKTLRLRQDDKDRRIFELERQLAEERREKEIIAKFVRETVR